MIYAAWACLKLTAILRTKGKAGNLHLCFSRRKIRTRMSVAEGLPCTRHSDVKPCDKMVKWVLWRSLLGRVALPWQVSCPAISVAVLKPKGWFWRWDQSLHESKRRYWRSQSMRTESQSSLQLHPLVETRGRVDPKPHWVWSCRSGCLPGWLDFRQKKVSPWSSPYQDQQGIKMGWRNTKYRADRSRAGRLWPVMERIWEQQK